MVGVRLYVEGGGDQRATLGPCRQGYRALLDKVLGDRPKPRIIACGGRRAAFDDFCTALGGGANNLLLVDAEDPVQAGQTAWQHLSARDGWQRPPAATDDHAHLMVECMESWFLADKDALAAFYGQGFRKASLPANPKVEEIARKDLAAGLEAATRDTRTKGRYHKTRHGFDLLARIDATRLEHAAPWARRFFETLRAWCRP